MVNKYLRNSFKVIFQYRVNSTKESSYFGQLTYFDKYFQFNIVTILINLNIFTIRFISQHSQKNRVVLSPCKNNEWKPNFRHTPEISLSASYFEINGSLTNSRIEVISIPCIVPTYPSILHAPVRPPLSPCYVCRVDSIICMRTTTVYVRTSMSI